MFQPYISQSLTGMRYQCGMKRSGLFYCLARQAHGYAEAPSPSPPGACYGKLSSFRWLMSPTFSKIQRPSEPETWKMLIEVLGIFLRTEVVWSACLQSSCMTSSWVTTTTRSPVNATQHDATTSVCSMKLAVKAMHTRCEFWQSWCSALLLNTESARNHVDWCFTLVLLSYRVQAGNTALGKLIKTLPTTLLSKRRWLVSTK